METLLRQRNSQRKDLSFEEILSLPISAGSRTSETGRVTKITLKKIMAVTKAIVEHYSDMTNGNFHTTLKVAFTDFPNTTIVDYADVDVSFAGITSAASFKTACETAILAYASFQGYSNIASNADIIWPFVSDGRSFANPSRSLNSTFQISTTRDALVSYSVDIAVALSLTTGQQGTVYLRYADDSGFSTNVTEVCRFVNGNTGTLTIGLALTQSATGTLSGMIPAGKYVKLVTENNTGTPTFTYRRAQEVLL